MNLLVVVEELLKLAILSDVKSSGTAGGSFTSGSWVDRTLNTEVDPESFVTFSSSNDYFALGVWNLQNKLECSGTRSSSHQTKLVYADNTSFTSSSKKQGKICEKFIMIPYL